MTVCLHALSLGKRDVAQRARREQLLDLEQPVGEALLVICHKTAYDGLAAASLRHCDPAALRATLAAAALMRGLGKREDELAPLGWWTTIVRIPCAEGTTAPS